MASNKEPQRRRIYFSGRVQGVGFRATTCQIAEPLDITGFVKNQSDGRVLLVVEGHPSEIDRLVGQIEATMARYIRGQEAFEEPATGEFQEFRWTS